MLRMDEFNKIRKEYHVRQKSIYQIAKEYRRSWDTVKNIVSMDETQTLLRGTRPNRIPTVITHEVENKIISLIEFEKIHKVHRKQRFTASYIYKKLKEEGIYHGSSKRIRTTVSRLRRELNQSDKRAYLELDFELGKYLQVDHGETEVKIGEMRVNGYLFVASVPGASLRYCQFYLTKAQEAWGHFHELCFGFFGGKFEKVIYDNDSVVKNNKTNEPSQFCLEMEIHYGFEAVFCNKESGWEKGAVENAVGYCRRNFLAGLSEFPTLESLNTYLEEKCLKEISEEDHYVTKRPLSELFDEVGKIVISFPKGKTWGKWETLKVNEFQQVTYQGYGYSVPERFVGSYLKVLITVTHIEIYDGHQLVYNHSRRYLENDDALVLDHYLDQLLKKPRAITQAKVIKNQKFPDYILELQRKLYDRYGEKEAGLEFIQILMLKRKASEADFSTSLQLGLSYNAINFKAIKSILDQLQIEQMRSLSDFTKWNIPKIDGQFCLEKYSCLEQMETDYD